MFDISVLSRCSVMHDPLLERPFNGDFNGVGFICRGCIPEILIAFKKIRMAEAQIPQSRKCPLIAPQIHSPFTRPTKMEASSRRKDAPSHSATISLAFTSSSLHNFTLLTNFVQRTKGQ